MWTPQLIDAARELATLLEAQRIRLVLAESCTSGLAAAALGTVPGISNWFCGSAVVYRTGTKAVWLGVDPPGFRPPEPDCVGPQTSKSLASALLAKTPEADVAAAISGHLGPNAPSELDGCSFTAVLSKCESQQDSPASGTHAAFKSSVIADSERTPLRMIRQEEAAVFLLQQIALHLQEGSRTQAPAG